MFEDNVFVDLTCDNILWWIPTRW